MGCRFGGYDCLDPWCLWQQCRELSLPTDLWFGRANSFRCPLGQQSGQGWILLTRQSLNALGMDTPRDLQSASA